MNFVRLAMLLLALLPAFALEAVQAPSANDPTRKLLRMEQLAIDSMRALPSGSVEWARAAQDVIRARLNLGLWADEEVRVWVSDVLRIILGDASVDQQERLSALSLAARASYRFAEFETAQAHLLNALELVFDKTAASQLSLRVARVDLELGRLDSAYDRAVRDVQEQETRLGDDPARIFGLTVLGDILRTQGKFDEARLYFDLAVHLGEAEGGTGSADAAVKLAALLMRQGDHVPARALVQKALELRRQHLPQDHPDIAKATDYLARTYYYDGDYARARTYWVDALELLEAKLGKAHAELASIMSNLATILVAQGQYAQARPYFERTIAIYERVLGPDHSYVAIVTMGLGSLHSKMGDHEVALSLRERALQINLSALGPEHPSTANAMFEIAKSMGDLGRHDDAYSKYAEVLKLWEKNLGPEHRDVAAVLSSLASHDARRHRFDDARNKYSRALSIYIKSLGSNHPYLSNVYQQMGVSERRANNTSAARSHFNRALEIRRETLGESHPLVAQTLLELARLDLESGAFAQAISNSINAEAISRRHLQLTARSEAERDAILYAAHRTPGIGVALSVLEHGSEPTPKVWNEAVRSRASVLDEMIDRHQALLESPEVSDQYDHYVAMSSKLAELLTRRLDAATGAAYRQQLIEAQEALADAQRELARAGMAIRGESTSIRMSFEQIRDSLPDQYSLLSFFRYQSHGLDSSLQDKYFAFLVDRSTVAPVAIPLGDARVIDGAVSIWRQRAADPTLDPTEAGLAVRRLVWDPIADLLSETTGLLIVPAGKLHLLNIAALPTDDNRFLADESLDLHFINSERDVLDPVAAQPGSGMLALGGAEFGVHPSTVSNPPDSCSTLDSLRFEFLPGTVRELQLLETLWKTYSDSESMIQLSGDNATEEAVMTQAPGKRILHLATHGFFLERQCATQIAGLRGIGGLSAEPTQGGLKEEGHFALSGLAVAGANRRSLNNREGILTAEELSTLNLGGVQWVVLSACETGVGTVVEGEGVFGMRRALQVAGVGSVIMSLWNIDDASSTQWMSALYTARLGKRLSTAGAVHAANLNVLRARREKGLSLHPFYWAGFVASGDWR